MKGKLLKNKEGKWVVEYEKAIYEDRQIQLHPEQCVDFIANLFENKNVNFVIVNDNNAPITPYAKLIIKQEEDYIQWDKNQETLSKLDTSYSVKDVVESIIPKQEESSNWNSIMRDWGKIDSEARKNNNPKTPIDVIYWLREHYLPPIER